MSQETDTTITLWVKTGCQRRSIAHLCVMCKRLALISSLIFAFVFTGQSAESPTKDGGWSETVNGLRARLVFGEVHIFAGTRIPEVYLELHNASDVGNPMEFDFDAGKSIRFDLRNSDGEEPDPNIGAYMASGPIFGPFHITIPMGGTLKFPITWSGHGITPNGGTALGFEGAFWVIPPSDKRQYFLSATLDAPQTTRDRILARRGTIKIPPVIVPTGK